MPIDGSIINRLARALGLSALTALACTAYALTAAGQGGTVAVTGDGTTSSTTKPAVGDTIPDDDATTTKGKKRKKSPGAAAAKAAASSLTKPRSRAGSCA